MQLVYKDRQNKNTKENEMTNDYVYTKAGTDITIRWKKLYDYVPPSESQEYKQKWAAFRALCNRSVDDIGVTHD